MATRITLEGASAFQAALRNMSNEVRDEVGREVTAVALELQGDVKRSILKGPASGRTYQKYNPRRTHTASAPGQPPMSDTGRLANSITFDQEGQLTASVGSRLAYALYLEYGTSRMAARPFFRPAVERMRRTFQARLEAAVARATR